jgi:hypothetical protein
MFWAFALLIKRSRAWIHTAHARLIHHLDFQIILNSNLAGQPDVGGKVRFNSEPITLEFSHLTRITSQHCDAASSTASIATAAMEDVDAGIFDSEY